MATKLIVIAFLCAALIAVVQSAPQYAQGEEPTYDEDDDEPVKPHSSADPDASYEEFDPSQLTEYANTAQDPGRRPHFLEQANSNNGDQLPSQSDSSSESTEH
nr:anophelin-like funestolin [Anopheles funestus]